MLRLSLRSRGGVPSVYAALNKTLVAEPMCVDIRAIEPIPNRSGSPLRGYATLRT
jgi:hypothetical protein